MGINQVGIGSGQANIAHGCTGRSTQVGTRNRRDQGWQLHTTHIIVCDRRSQARGHHCVEGDLDLRDHSDLFAIEGRLVRIHFLADRQEVLLCYCTGGGDRRIKSLAIMVSIARAAGQGFGIKHFVQHEFEIALVKERGWHWSLTSGWLFRLSAYQDTAEPPCHVGD